MRALWTVLELGQGLLSAEQQAGLTRRFWVQVRARLTRRRKEPRSCPRAVRQPIRGWPRIRVSPSTCKCEITIVLQTNGMLVALRMHDP